MYEARGSCVGSCRVAFAVRWKQSVEVLQAALEFDSFLLIQRLVFERLQQRSGGRDKNQYVRADRHDALAQRQSGESLPRFRRREEVLPHNCHLVYRTNTSRWTDSADRVLETLRSTDTRRKPSTGLPYYMMFSGARYGGLVFLSPFVRRERRLPRP